MKLSPDVDKDWLEWAVQAIEHEWLHSKHGRFAFNIPDTAKPPLIEDAKYDLKRAFAKRTNTELIFDNQSKLYDIVVNIKLTRFYDYLIYDGKHPPMQRK
jgi:hypothetical protein